MLDATDIILFSIGIVISINSPIISSYFGISASINPIAVLFEELYHLIF